MVEEAYNIICGDDIFTKCITSTAVSLDEIEKIR